MVGTYWNATCWLFASIRLYPALFFILSIAEDSSCNRLILTVSAVLCSAKETSSVPHCICLALLSSAPLHTQENKTVLLSHNLLRDKTQWGQSLYLKPSQSKKVQKVFNPFSQLPPVKKDSKNSAPYFDPALVTFVYNFSFCQLSFPISIVLGN